MGVETFFDLCPSVHCGVYIEEFNAEVAQFCVIAEVTLHRELILFPNQSYFPFSMHTL